MKPFTFSNGLTVPKGVEIGVPTIPLQFDDTVYENPTQFDGFRFHRSREQAGESSKYHASTSSVNYVHFGHGHHAWFFPRSSTDPILPVMEINTSPGRFFAINEMKMIAALLIGRFDIKTANGERPKDVKLGGSIVPDPHAEILFRRRKP